MNGTAMVRGLFLSAVILTVSIGTASAITANGPFGKHGAYGGHYCPFNRWACINSVGLGNATAEQIAGGNGNIDITVTHAGGDSARFSFHRDMGVGAALADSLFPIEQDLPLDPQVAYALGYKSVVLKQGFYRVKTSPNAFGDVAFPVQLSGPIGVPGVSPIGMVAITLLLGLGGLVAINRRRTTSA